VVDNNTWQLVELSAYPFKFIRILDELEKLQGEIEEENDNSA